MTSVRAKITKKRPGSAYRPASPSPAGRGGGAFNEDGTLTVADCRNGFGGGIYVGEGTVTIQGSKITGNEAEGGAGGAGGTDGQGVGGGLYIAAGSVCLKKTKIKGNEASTSDDDVFGVFTIC